MSASEKMMDKRTAAMGTAPIGPLLLRMSIPAMISMVMMSLYNIVDTLWVSGLPNGTEAIAALTVLMPLQQVPAAIGMGISAGITSLVSRRFGERKLEEIHAIAGNAVTLPIVLGIAIGAICLIFPEPLALAFGGSQQLVGPAVSYLTIVAWGFPFQIYSTSMDGLIRGSGDTKTPMYIHGAATLLNAILDPFLIYGWGPFPMLGLRGAAIATLLAQILGAVLAMGYVLSSRSPYRISPATLWLKITIMRDIARVGFPSFLNGCLRSTVGLIYNWVLAGFGPAAIAAQGLSMRVMMLMLSFMGPGVSQALVPIVGFNFGAKNYRRMWRTWLTASVWLSGIGIVLSTLIIVFASTILAPFAHDPEFLHLSVWAVRAKVCTIFLVEPQMMGIFTFQGMGMGFRALVLTMARSVIFVIPALILLSDNFGVYGAFAAQPLSDVLGLLIASAMLLRTYRQYPVTASV